MQTIFLTGFMGCGKTSVGNLLAEHLRSTFIDLDAVISDASGMEIREIFATQGENHFRAMEKQSLNSLYCRPNMVVSTGGGVVLDKQNRDWMRQKGYIVNLTASAHTIYERLASDTERPLLQADNSIEKISAMLAEREEFYSDADVRIDTSGKSLEDVVKQILIWLKRIDFESHPGRSC